jgi:hypothetical protein
LDPSVLFSGGFKRASACSSKEIEEALESVSSYRSRCLLLPPPPPTNTVDMIEYVGGPFRSLAVTCGFQDSLVLLLALLSLLPSVLRNKRVDHIRVRDEYMVSPNPHDESERGVSLVR